MKLGRAERLAGAGLECNAEEGVVEIQAQAASLDVQLFSHFSQPSFEVWSGLAQVYT